MTREEISQYIKNELTNENAEIYLDVDDYKIIVEALEQESCEDCISRRAVIDVIERWLECSGYNEAERHIMRAVQSVLYDSPSVNPQLICEEREKGECPWYAG